jgi:hypothetical protein
MLRRKEASGENYEAAHSMRIVDPDQYPPGRLLKRCVARNPARTND